MYRRWWTLAVICAATFMLLLDVTIVIVALPDIQHSLHADFTDAQWVIDAYSLAVAAALVTFGSLADRHGRRPSISLSDSLFAVLIGTLLATALRLFRRLSAGLACRAGDV